MAELYFAPLFSGSSGNAVLAACGKTALLIDAGVSCARLEREFKAVGARPDAIGALLITHEHADHIRGAGVFARKYGVPVYATEGTWDAIGDKLGPIAPGGRVVISGDQDFYLGDLNVQPFATPHDAAQSVGYCLTAPSGARFTLATDVGCLRGGWLERAAGSGAVMLESNYDVDMLAAGPYPYELKRRILSRKGHLSNDDAGEAAVALARGGTRRVVLSHLSKENNFPALALKTCEAHLLADGLETGENFRLSVANRDGATGVFAVRPN